MSLEKKLYICQLSPSAFPFSARETFVGNGLNTAQLIKFTKCHQLSAMANHTCIRHENACRVAARTVCYLHYFSIFLLTYNMRVQNRLLLTDKAKTYNWTHSVAE